MSNLVVERLTKSFAGRRVLDGVSLEFPCDGTVSGVFGPNGAGKTTLFRCLMGLETADATRLSLGETDLRGLPAHALARAGVSLMFQRPVAIDGVSVRQGLTLLLEARFGREAGARADAALEAHGLAGLSSRRMDRLSVGEGRLLDFARALALEPTVLLLDEPFSGLDPLHLLQMKEQIAQTAKPGRAVVLTDHNVSLALDCVQRAYVLYDTKVLAQGTPAELKQHAQVRSLYLGAL
jgi:lipopolysaccharide export system ATP-binding protein